MGAVLSEPWADRHAGAKIQASLPGRVNGSPKRAGTLFSAPGPVAAQTSKLLSGVGIAATILGLTRDQNQLRNRARRHQSRHGLDCRVLS